MQKQANFGRSLKRYAIAIGVLVWFFILVFAVVKNPSGDDAAEKMSMLKADMATMLGEGEKGIVYRNESAKFGGALLSVIVRKDMWPWQFRATAVHTLVGLGWKQTSADSSALCKMGAIAKIQEHVEDYKGAPVVLVSMQYNASTIKLCR